ncbi:MAG: MFS transporter [Acidobacteriia bacterium]|nr:MFS transporter [Terriglobia bacterium]
MLNLTYRKLRWIIAGWLTLSTILNLIDRQTLSILAPLLRDKFHLSPQDYANIVSAFLISYAVMYTVGGRFVDWIGERVGMAACILWWSICAMLTSLAQGFWSLGIIRFLLGIGEPGNYPAALRATTRWFPKAERGLPIALFSSGSAVGNIIAPPMIAGLMLLWDWRAAFIIPGALGLIWLVVWLWIYRLPEHLPGISQEELAWIRNENSQGVASASASGPQRWGDLLKDRNVLALVLCRLVSDPVWYFYLFWIPEYLTRERGFSLAEIGLYAWIPFVAGAVGGMVGGRASDRLVHAGVSPARARTRVLYISAAIAPLGMLTGKVHTAAMAIALIAVMAFVVYSWFINTAALIPDLFSEKVVGSVLGLMGTAGSAGAVVFTTLVGFLLTHYSYTAVFLLAGSMHLLASLILWSLLREPHS